jgi:hypothetical protein
MIEPSWLTDGLAGLMLATAAYCAGRVFFAFGRDRRIDLDADLAHTLMAIAMAGMFVPHRAFLPSPVWAAIFGLIAAWYLMRSVLERGHGGAPLAGLRHHAGHLVAALAMLYMVLATPTPAAGPPTSSASSSGSMSSMGSMGSMGSMTGGDTSVNSHVPLAALLFTVLLFAYGVLVAGLIPAGAERLSPSLGPGGLGAVGRGELLAPRGSALREVVMSLGMAAMLITML